jgi:hypothetical protein
MRMSDFAENVSGYPNPNGYPDAPGPSLHFTNTPNVYLIELSQTLASQA